MKILSDEKIFTVGAVFNHRNDRYLAESIADVKGTFRTKHPVKVMVLGVVASDRKMPPFFFKLGEKMSADVYYKVLRYHVLPWLPATQPRRWRNSAKLTLLISGQQTSDPPPART